MRQLLRNTVIATMLQAALVMSAYADTKTDQRHMLNSGTAAVKANKRLVYDFWREVLEGGHLDLAPKYLTPSYIQHNPNVPTGRDGFVTFFSQYAKPHEIASTIQRPLIDIVAEGDLVVLSFVKTFPDPTDPANPGKTYTTTWFDMFRIQNGMIAEHWDSAHKEAPATAQVVPVPKDPMHFDTATQHQYAGRYMVKSNGNFPPDFALVLSEKDDHLWLDMAGTGVGSSGAEALVARKSDDVFQLSSGDTVQFARGSDGVVYQATLSSTGQSFAGVKTAK